MVAFCAVCGSLGCKNAPHMVLLERIVRVVVTDVCRWHFEVYHCSSTYCLVEFYACCCLVNNKSIVEAVGFFVVCADDAAVEGRVRTASENNAVRQELEGDRDLTAQAEETPHERESTSSW